MDGLGIETQYESRGDVFNFNGFGYSRDYFADKTDAPVELINAVALSTVASFVAGPAITSALTGTLGAAGAKAASAAITNLAKQYVQGGDLSWEDALMSAALSYGGAELSDALQGSGVLGDVGSKIAEFGNNIAEGGGDILTAALQAGGMSLVTQLVTEGEIDWKDAAVAAALAGGTAALTQFLSDVGREGAEDEVLEEIKVTAKHKGAKVGEDMYQLEDGTVIYAPADGKSNVLGNMADLDTDGDGYLNANDLQEVDVNHDYVSEKIGFEDSYEMGDTVYVDANGNPVDPKLVRFGPDGYVGYDANGNRVPVTGVTYDEAFGGEKGGLKWEFGLNEDGSVSTTDGAIYYENGELAYEKVDGQWVDGNGSIIDDPNKVDELTMIAAKAIDEPINQIDYTDANGRPVTFGKVPLRDGYETGQYAGTIYGRNGQRYDFDPKTGLYKYVGDVDNPGATADQWYDPITGYTYEHDSENTLVVTRYDEPFEEPVDPEQPEQNDTSTDSSKDGGNQDGLTGKNENGDPADPGGSVPGGGGNDNGSTSSGGGGYEIPDLSTLFPDSSCREMTRLLATPLPPLVTRLPLQAAALIRMKMLM